MISQIFQEESIFSIPEDEWNTLVTRSMTNTPFQTFAYQKAWWENLKPGGSKLQSIVIRQNNGQLAAIACLYITNEGIVNFNGCVEETDYLDIIAEARHAEEAWLSVFDCLLSNDYPAWRLVELCNIPAISPSRAILPQIADRCSLTLVESIDEVCPVIDLPASIDAYLQSLDSKQRREINRKQRRARGAEAKFHIIGPEDDLDQAVDDFLELLKKSTFEKRDWLNDGRRSLFHTIAHSAQQAGLLQLSFMEIDGQRAAGLFNFDYEGRIWVYNSGLDPEAFGNLSLGVVLTFEAVAWAIENGRFEFDFLRGSETYKYHFGAKDTKIYRLDISRSPLS
jgi:CelD/BcsL family acetyltransferase involved in cellulose biosynthesis